MNGKEATFDVNKYKKPVMLSEKESIVQVIKNAFFMVPGNDPLHPDRGVNILQYLYKTEDYVDASIIQHALLQCCKNTSLETQITSFRVSVADVKGIPTMMVALEIALSDGVEDQLAIIIQKKSNIVHFNYKYFSEMTKLAS